MGKRALVSGATGQDSSYLIELLLAKGYEVTAIDRRKSSPNNKNIAHLLPKIRVVTGDITDPASVNALVSQKFDEIYGLAAQSFVGTSFDQPYYTFQVNAVGVLNFLEAIRTHSPETQFYQASSVTFDSPVMIRIDGVIKRTNFEEAYNLFRHRDVLGYKSFEVFSCNKYGNAGFYSVKDVVDHGFKRVYSVDLFNGINLKITGDHSLILLKDSVLKECKVCDFKEDDRLLTFCMDKSTVGSIKNLKWEYIKKKNCPNRWGRKCRIVSNKFDENIVLDENIAYLMGMFCAEGYGYYKRRNAGVCFTFGKHDFDRNRPKEVFDLINNIFNIRSRVIDRETSVQVVANGIKIVTFFNKFVGTCSHDKRVCSELFDSPLSVRIAFLNGYMGDAHIVKKNNSIVFTTVHYDLAVDIVWLMRISGISCKINSRNIKDHTSPQKTIIRGSIVWDVHVPGYSSWLSEKKRGCRIPNDMVLPKDGFLEKIYRERDGYFCKNEKNPSRDILKKNNNIWGYSDLGMVNVKSIVDTGLDMRVGDFSVEGEERWFCGPVPILVHNTSEQYGGVTCPPSGYNEQSAFYPRSPYGVSKLAAFWLVKNYREAYGLKCCSGILFNHTSPRRGHEFVTQKVCTWVKKMIACRKDIPGHISPLDLEYALNKVGVLKLGNLDSQRDFGHAKDFVHGMHLILNQPFTPLEDFVLGTGDVHSIREFVEAAIKEGLGIDLAWKVKEDRLPEGEDMCSGITLVESVKEFYRPSEVNVLKADFSKAKKLLGWEPSISFNDIIKDMLYANTPEM